MLGISANHRDESEEEQGKDQNNLAAGEPEFRFTVGFDGQEVQNARERGQYICDVRSVPSVDSGHPNWQRGCDARHCKEKELLPIADNHCSADSGNRTRFCDHRTPERQHQSESRDLKGNQKGLIKAMRKVLADTPEKRKRENDGQKVPSDHKAKGLVNPFAGETNEAATDGIGSGHLGEAVIHHGQEHRLNRVRKEQAARTTGIETSTNTDEKSSSNGTTNGNELDLAVTEVTLEVIGIVGHQTFLDILGSVARLEPHSVQDTGVLVLVLIRKCHVGQGPVNGVS